MDAGTWSALGAEALAVRQRVFVEEQGVPEELERDAADPQCLHVVARDAAGRVVGTGRLLPDGHIGRLAVLADTRGLGVGNLMMRCLMREAAVRGHAEVVLNAQTSAAGFYRRLGFIEHGAVFMEAGLAHVEMRKRLGSEY